MRGFVNLVPPRMGFLTVVLWLCAAGALWLFLSPAAFQRRALTNRVRQASAETEIERLRTEDLERWRDGLESDPTVIEREARKLGYGNPDERSYPISATEDLADAGTVWSRNANKAERTRTAMAADRQEIKIRIRKTVAPVLMAIVGAAIAFLFFKGLRIDDPGDRAEAPTVDKEIY